MGDSFARLSQLSRPPWEILSLPWFKGIQSAEGHGMRQLIFCLLTSCFVEDHVRNRKKWAVTKLITHANWIWDGGVNRNAITKFGFLLKRPTLSPNLPMRLPKETYCPEKCLK